MQTLTTIHQRETIRRFKNGISQEQLEQLLIAGTWAPNHGKREPWRFIVLNTPAAYDKLLAVYAQSGKTIPPLERWRETRKFPTMVVVVLPKNPEEKEYKEDVLAHGALIQNIQLAAWEQGIGVVWKTRFFPFNEAFGIQADEEVTGFLLLGEFEASAQASERERQPLATKMTIVE
ncbi:MAG: nitroreductase family protein [Culicoidibacterales bacterium]